MIDEGWWKGHCHGRTGLFPAAYVQLHFLACRWLIHAGYCPFSSNCVFLLRLLSMSILPSATKSVKIDYTTVFVCHWCV
ncbi:hypothetical protein INR49_005012 [Caranx melampygus]|nr:hypothetical protein INR49_005012 [Caranx melampygus]